RELDHELADRVEHVDGALRVDGLDRVRARRRAFPAWNEVDPRGRRDERVPAETLNVTGRGHDPHVAIDGQRACGIGRQRRGEIPDRLPELRAVVRLVFPELAGLAVEDVEVVRE